MATPVARKRVLAAALAALVAGLLVVGLLVRDSGSTQRTPAEPDSRRAQRSEAEESERAEPPRPESRASAPAEETQRETEELIAYLRERFGPTIDHPSTRIALIEKAMAYLQRAYPDDWRERVDALLAKVFPGRADELASLLEKRLRYGDLLKERRADYEALDPRDRRDAVWADRYRVFGDEADAIWAAARRAERVQIALEEIDEGVGGADLDAKIERYVSAIHDAYGDRAVELTSRRQTELVNHFLEVDAVQDELRQLEPDSRMESLRQIRGALGMDADALARWDDLDHQRDRMWTDGLYYEEQRQRLLATADGADTEASIRDLQDRVFGPAADTIRAEEESGFYRFARPRRIGRE